MLSLNVRVLHNNLSLFQNISDMLLVRSGPEGPEWTVVLSNMLGTPPISGAERR